MFFCLVKMVKSGGGLVEKNMLHICAESDARFKWKSQLNDHVLDRHTNEKKLQCTLCIESFKFRSNLKSHEVCHLTEKKYLCSICKNRFCTNIAWLDVK